MKFEITKNVQTTETIEVEFPSFFKKGFGWYYAVLSKDRVISCCSFSVGNFGSIHIKEAAQGEPITEAEFLEAYDKALAKIEYPNVPA